ncbi:hypothetical protein FisN_27Lh019 [Fistulifera solaris]|uniref:Uncharacterized protein n=1 Tax=Fistulifera solaris TaxID=1519565 RepID=A0A388SD17_FISSO|nr:hypothetical protein FisN_27Lh019 [Fistulifera solaris]|eukprot:GBO90610.1 hypothetical protein FisN_27Lh019 [Fistulifera solaris]
MVGIGSKLDRRTFSSSYNTKQPGVRVRGSGTGTECGKRKTDKVNLGAIPEAKNATMSEQQQVDIDANDRTDDDSAKLEDLQQELKDHSAAFKPETATHAEKVHFRRVRNAIYSRIKYRRRNRLMKTLSAQKADLESRNHLIREQNTKLEQYINVAKTIAENREGHAQSQYSHLLTSQAILALERMRHGAQINPPPPRRLLFESLPSRFTDPVQAAAVQGLSAQRLQQEFSQGRMPEGLSLLSLQNQLLGENSLCLLATPPEYAASRIPAGSSTLSLEDLELLNARVAHHQESTGAGVGGNPFLNSLEGILGPFTQSHRSANEIMLDLLSVEIIQLELDRRLSGNADPGLDSFFQGIAVKLLRTVDDLKTRSAISPPESLRGEIEIVRLSVDLIRSFGCGRTSFNLT